MNCAGAREWLGALVDDALDPAEAAEVRAHLDACDACRAHLAEIEAVVDLVREIPDPGVPEGFAAEVVARLPRKRVPAAIKWLAPLAAAACLLLLVRVGFDSDKDRPAWQVAETKNEAQATRDRGVLTEEGDAGSATGPAIDEEASGYLGRATAPGKMPHPASGPMEELREAPADAPAPDPEAAPERVAERERAAPSPPAKSRRFAGDGRKYAVRGAEPDTAAGVILAELRRKRAREAQGDEPAGEKVVQGRAGEVSGMLLYLTPGELEFVTCLLEERPGVRVARLNGHGKKKDRSRGERADLDAGDGDDRAARRLRVELRFR